MELSRNVRRLALFILISLGSLGLVIFCTVNDKTVTALARIQPVFLLLCFCVWACAFVFDALSNVFFTLGVEEKIKGSDAFKLAAIRIFFNLITPFSSGGQPVSVYILHTLGIPAGKGSSIVVTRLMSLSFFSTSGAILSFLFFGNIVSSNKTLQATFFGTGVAIVIVYGIVVAALLCLPFLSFLVRASGSILHRLRIVVDFGEFYTSGVEHAIHARSSFKNYFTRRPARFAFGVLSAFGWYACQVLILYFIILGLGIKIGFAHGFALAALLIFLISFMPTPGAAGFGEFLFFVIFSGTVKSELVGIAVIIWRIFYQYISAVLGALFTARYFSGLWTKNPGNDDKLS